ncbi:MAG: hypothetical protein R3C05_17625 [Pirellulaceae bacterium]
MSVGRCDDQASATALLNRQWDAGNAMRKFEEMVAAQGGRLDGHLPVATKHEIVSQRMGYLKAIDCRIIGQCVVALGGGRQRTEDSIDPRVGIVWRKKIGDRVEKGETIGWLHADSSDVDDWCLRLSNALVLTDETVNPRPLVLEQIGVKRWGRIAIRSLTHCRFVAMRMRLYSRFLVGAFLKTESEQVYVGCNVERTFRSA